MIELDAADPVLEAYDCVEFWTGSKTCFVSFASMGEGDPHGCHFEWKSTLLDKHGLSCVLMRDPSYHWYQDGVAGIGDVQDTAAYVRSLKNKCERLIAIGVSMGGFGALLYGILAEVPEILALAPQTLIGEDPRWKDNWAQFDHRPYPDIAALLPAPKSEITVFIGNEMDTSEDFKHYRRIKDDAKLQWVDGCEHATLARTLRDSGYFARFD